MHTASKPKIAHRCRRRRQTNAFGSDSLSSKDCASERANTHTHREPESEHTHVKLIKLVDNKQAACIPYVGLFLVHRNRAIWARARSQLACKSVLRVAGRRLWLGARDCVRRRGAGCFRQTQRTLSFVPFHAMPSSCSRLSTACERQTN